MNLLNTSSLDLIVHQNKEYTYDQVRHFKSFPKVYSSASGQYASQNLPKLVQLIDEVYQGKMVYFVDTRQDTHFELNYIPVSLKRIVLNDDNTDMKSEDVIKKEKEIAEFFVNKEVKFVPKESHGAPREEKVIHGAIIKDYIENPKWNNRHVFTRFALNENGPLTDVQVDEFLALLDKIKLESAWLHTNSIVGGGAALLFIVMKHILQNASVETLDTIVSIKEFSKYFAVPKEDDENRLSKIERTDFIKEFYTFAKTRENHQKWSDWKAQRN